MTKIIGSGVDAWNKESYTEIYQMICDYNNCTKREHSILFEKTNKLDPKIIFQI